MLVVRKNTYDLPMQPTVLVIDDTVSSATLVRHALAPEFRVLSALTGEDGLAIAEQERPDVVLLDLNLQVGSGMHVLSRARAGGYTGKLWVLSSRDPDFYRSLCEKHGADGFYDKANDQDQLIADLRALAQ